MAEANLRAQVTPRHRITLLLMAALCAGASAFLVARFSLCCPQPTLSNESAALGIAASAPFWLPALVPANSDALQRWFRRGGLAGGAIVAVFHVWTFVVMVRELAPGNVSEVARIAGASLLAASACAVGLAVLATLRHVETRAGRDPVAPHQDRQ